LVSFSFSFKPSVQKDLRKLPKQIITKIFKEIEVLKSNPFPPGAGKLSGAEHLYRIRVGDYRIVYEVQVAAKHLLIHYIRHRKDVYRSL